ncbi:hypothetical protein, partial [Burkholderia cepacia]|uniref:hypothetical protein n=1 Tax=Burkholderia cepacia TaxID=292 RepID=UPI001C720FD6
MAMGVRLACALDPPFETQSTCVRRTACAAAVIAGALPSFPGSEVKEMEVKGRNLSEGIPRSFT